MDYLVDSVFESFDGLYLGRSRYWRNLVGQGLGWYFYCENCHCLGHVFEAGTDRQLDAGSRPGEDSNLDIDRSLGMDRGIGTDSCLGMDSSFEDDRSLEESEEIDSDLRHNTD